ncbi:unnamed protein product [Cochlearia groenlandica]
MILVVALYATTLSRPVLAEMHVTPRLPFIPGSSVDLQKCWSTLFRVEGCATEIYKSILTGGCSYHSIAPPKHTTPDTPIVELTKCWSPLLAVEGCVTEIYKSVSTGKDP